MGKSTLLSRSFDFLDVKSQLRSGHDLIAMTALDEIGHIVQDSSLLQQRINAPLVGFGELNEDDVSDLVEASIMLLKFLSSWALEITIVKGTPAGWHALLLLVPLDLTLNDSPEVEMFQEMFHNGIFSLSHNFLFTHREGTLDNRFFLRHCLSLETIIPEEGKVGLVNEKARACEHHSRQVLIVDHNLFQLNLFSV